MNIKEELSCKYCNEIFNNPIALPCGDSICKHHIDELISNRSSNTFLCPLCNEENCSNLKFKVNKLIQRLIKRELHEFRLNPKYENSLKSLKTEIENLETILKDPENYIFEEISELKRQVDLDRERLKNEIDDSANDLIKQLESYEKKFMAEFKANIDLDSYSDLVESYKNQLKNYEKFLRLFSVENEKRDEKCIEIQKQIETLQHKTRDLKHKSFSKVSLKYQNQTESIFGRLIVQVGFSLPFFL